jgi:hypothetical protein
VQALTADGTGEHLHWSLIAQLADPDCAQAIGPGGEQAPGQWFSVARVRGASRVLVASSSTSSSPSTWALAAGCPSARRSCSRRAIEERTWPGSSSSPSMAAMPRLSRPSKAEIALRSSGGSSVSRLLSSSWRVARACRSRGSTTALSQRNWGQSVCCQIQDGAIHGA